jgi:multifunctional methyltransferase subunit TRM112
MQTHIVEGKLVCPNCKREYPIVNGIPNMILNESEI